MKRSSALGIITATALCCAAPLSLHWSQANTPSLAVDTAEARFGHPLTPMSVAGVNRRVNRRAYYGAAAAGAAGVLMRQDQTGLGRPKLSAAKPAIEAR